MPSAYFNKKTETRSIVVSVIFALLILIQLYVIINKNITDGNIDQKIDRLKIGERLYTNNDFHLVEKEKNTASYSYGSYIVYTINDTIYKIIKH